MAALGAPPALLQMVHSFNANLAPLQVFGRQFSMRLQYAHLA
jgi:hypothetical protein